MDEEQEGKQVNVLNKEKPRNHHNIPRKKGGNEEALVTKEMALSNLGKNIFIGDSAATSHMTSNKLGVYNLVPINRSVMIGNKWTKHQLYPQGEIGCHLKTQG